MVITKNINDLACFVLFSPVLNDWYNKQTYKRVLASNQKRVAHCVVAAGFLSDYMSDPQPCLTPI